MPAAGPSRGGETPGFASPPRGGFALFSVRPCGSPFGRRAPALDPCGPQSGQVCERPVRRPRSRPGPRLPILLACPARPRWFDVPACHAPPPSGSGWPHWPARPHSSTSRACTGERRSCTRTCPGGRWRSGFAVRRDLRRPRALPPQRPLVLARRPAVRVRPRVRRRRRVRARRARRHRHRLGPRSAAWSRSSCVFNLAQLALAASARRRRSLHLVAGDADALQPATWVGLYAATLASGALTILLLGGAIAIAEGNLEPPMLVQMFATDALVTLINARIAIAAALVVATDPRAVPVLLVPALTVFAVYRAYISERQRHERLEFLYDANRTLSALARGRRGARGAARPLARGLQRRRRRGPAVHRRRRRRCAPPTARATTA